MSGIARRGFTLVEILIVVVILGILAAIVIPQFTTASMEATRSAVLSQLQTIDNQIELYRAKNPGDTPVADPTEPLVEGGTNNGWGVLVSAEYLRDEPMNLYTGSTVLVAGNEVAALAEDKGSANGWYYEMLAPGLTVYGAGFNRTTQQLEHEYNP